MFLKKSYFIFPITKGSVNALMKLVGFSTSNKVPTVLDLSIYTECSYVMRVERANPVGSQYIEQALCHQTREREKYFI